MHNQLTFPSLTAILLLLLAPLLSGQQVKLTDEAAAFFDDSQVREIRIYFDDPDWYNTLLRAHQTTEDPYFPCRFSSAGVEIAQIGCRFKGNSSAQRNGIKKPFKLDFNRYNDDARFLGLKKLNVNNFDLQPDFMREKLVHEVAGKYVAALRSVYTRLYVNDAFYGLYLAVEQPDKVMMQSRYGSAEDGNLYEGEEQMGSSSKPTLSYLGDSQALYENVYLLKTNEEENDYSGLIHFLDVLNNTPTAELPSQWEGICDVTNWMYGMAVNNLVVNLDSYLGVAAEYYLYNRTEDGKFVYIQWDNNESFGITGDGTPRLTTPASTDPFWLPTSTNTGGPGQGGPNQGPPGQPGGGTASDTARPLLTKMWAVDEYKRLYLRALAQILREGFNPDDMSNRVTQLADLIRPHVLEDPNKAYTSAQFEAALNSTVGSIPGINQFVKARHAYLREYLNNAASPVDVRLNELVRVNTGLVKDEAGEADPWVEIYNMGPGPVTLTDYYLSDDPADPRKWKLPEKTLADGEFLLVWLDGQTDQGDTHAPFTPPAEGAQLYLFASAVNATEPLDTLTVSPLTEGESQVRLGMYGAAWTTTYEPTPGSANRVVGAKVSSGTGQLLINELMADNKTAFEDPDESGAFEDWFEILNPGAADVDMSGMYITDNPQNPTKWKVPDGVTIPAGGFLVFLADNETAQGSRHTSWALSAGGESISIFAADGATLIDTITFGPQTADVSYGRSPDGGATWTLLNSPTPGSPNSEARPETLTSTAAKVKLVTVK
jgi:spore coat protein CotH